MNIIDVMRLADIFEYVDGRLFWKNKISNVVQAKKEAGFLSPASKKGRGSAYRRVEFEGKTYYIHRIIYAMHHKIWPNVVDHIDGNPLNNRIENLRECQQLQNSSNRKISKNNTSGVAGVYLTNKKWKACICSNYELIYLGTFATKQEAIDARKKKQDELFKEFQRVC